MKWFSLFKKKKVDELDVELPSPINSYKGLEKVCSECPIKENGVCPFNDGCASINSQMKLILAKLRKIRGVAPEAEEKLNISKHLVGLIMHSSDRNKRMSYMISDITDDGMYAEISERYRYTRDRNGKVYLKKFKVSIPYITSVSGSLFVDLAALKKVILNKNSIWTP